MAAEKAFQDVLDYVSKSRLNFSIYQTPFSAQLSLKKSFAKHFQNDDQYEAKEDLELVPKKDLEVKIKRVEMENAALRASLENMEEAATENQEKFENQTQKLKIALDDEKKHSKLAELKMAELREDLLKVKSERRKSSESLKVEKQNVEALEKENNNLKKVNIEIQKTLKDKNEHLNLTISDLKSSESEKETLKHNLSEASQQLKNSKLKNQADMQFQIKCSECDVIAPSYDQMKQHERSSHYRNKSSQYEKVSEFKEYPCFYCETTISSEHTLKNHKTVCTQSDDWGTQEMYAYPCDECGAECTSLEVLGEHKRIYHDNQTSINAESGTFWCDICPLHFERDVDLKFHKRGCHWD